jgi:molybdate transport system substrate-binding protein
LKDGTNNFVKFRNYLLTGATLIGVVLSHSSYAGEVKVAVAANFTTAMKVIVKDFEQSSRHKTVLSFGSTGKLYAQILHNAPFEVFLAADQQRPRLLEEKQLTKHRLTYAIGKLVLWSSDSRVEVSEAALKRSEFNKLALANPKTAPYGAAAVTAMQRLGVNESLMSKRVYGNSIAQTHQLVATGNAQMGFVALAQIALDDSGNSWEIPQTLYEPIRQDAVLLDRGKNNPAAVELLNYLKSDAARIIIHKYGYTTE